MTFWNEVLGGGVGYVEGDRYRTRCLHAGDGDGPPLVLIHGIGGHCESFVRNALPLARRLEDRSIYAIDLIGHGFTDAPTDLSYDVADYVDHVADFVHALGHESAHVHGESLGGWIAGRIGVDRPDLVESIGLNTTIGIGASVQDQVSGDVRKQQDEEMQDLYDRTTRMLEEGVPREAVRHRLDWLFVESAPEELVDTRHRIYQREAVQEVMPTIYELLLRESTGEEFLSGEELANLDVPSLVIHTAQNPGTKVELIELVTELLPDHEYHLFEESAHWPQFEEPERFNETTARFIAGL